MSKPSPQFIPRHIPIILCVSAVFAAFWFLEQQNVLAGGTTQPCGQTSDCESLCAGDPSCSTTCASNSYIGGNVCHITVSGECNASWGGCSPDADVGGCWQTRFCPNGVGYQISSCGCPSSDDNSDDNNPATPSVPPPPVTPPPPPVTLISCGRCSNVYSGSYATWSADSSLGCENDINNVSYAATSDCSSDTTPPPIETPPIGSSEPPDRLHPTPSTGGGTITTFGSGGHIQPSPTPLPPAVSEFGISNLIRRTDPSGNSFYIVLAMQMRVGYSLNIVWTAARAASCVASCAYTDNKGIPVSDDCEWHGSVSPTGGNQRVQPKTQGIVTYTLACTGTGGDDTKTFQLGVKLMSWQEVFKTPSTLFGTLFIPSPINNLASILEVIKTRVQGIR